MATIDDIINWANTLPAWKGDVVRRLLNSAEQSLSEKDYSEVLSLAKSELNLAPPPANIMPIFPSSGSCSGTPESKIAIKLLSIDNVQNVNLILEGQSHPFAEYGVTIVYGDNGSGKSGYARILKLACQARDKKDQIHPNVFSTISSGTPTATIKIKQEDEQRDIIWTQGIPPDPILTNISVFDSGCARVITDDRNEITYLPYGADVFQKTVDVILKVKADLQSEVNSLSPLKDSGIQDDTPSALFLESLSEKTSTEDIELATIWTSDDDSELAVKEELIQSISKATKEISRLNRIKNRIETEARKSALILESCQDITDKSIKTIMEELKAAKKAHSIVVAERQTPEPLSGIASTNQWELLYNAAKKYSEEIAYPRDPFPKLDDAVCVLCQQPLNKEAIARFNRFKKFMEDTTSFVLSNKRDAMNQLRTRLENISPLSGTSLESIYDEVFNLDFNVAESLKAFYNAIEKRKQETIDSLHEDKDPDLVAFLPSWPSSIEQSLRGVSNKLSERIAEITSASKPDEYKKLLDSSEILKSRKALSKRKEDIRKFAEKYRRNTQLSQAINSLRTHEITRQGTAIIKKNLTPELLRAFNEELSKLDATRIPISMKAIGGGGETVHEMLIDGANLKHRIHVSDILSEGEVRVIAIAGFLAELHLCSNKNAIVLDDPVSSLDHVFTMKIAERLAHEGLTRQVIIFTHNIAFLMELQSAADTLAKRGTPVKIVVNTLHRKGGATGVITDGAPWHAQSVNKRVNYLDSLAHKNKINYDDDMEIYNKEAAYIYGLLREAWESCIEEDLFDGIVCRYRNSVQTLKLDQIIIEDKDCQLVDQNMSKASTWMTGHDKSKALCNNRPNPEEMLGDIAMLRDFSSALRIRKAKTRKRRKALLKAE